MVYHAIVALSRDNRTISEQGLTGIGLNLQHPMRFAGSVSLVTECGRWMNFREVDPRWWGLEIPWMWRSHSGFQGYFAFFEDGTGIYYRYGGGFDSESELSWHIDDDLLHMSWQEEFSTSFALQDNNLTLFTPAPTTITFTRIGVN